VSLNINLKLFSEQKSESTASFFISEVAMWYLKDTFDYELGNRTKKNYVLSEIVNGKEFDKED
jgi:hypothetical protein